MRHEELLRRERIPGQGQHGDDGCGERRQPEIPVHAPSFQICKWCAETMTPGQAMGLLYGETGFLRTGTVNNTRPIVATEF